MADFYKACCYGDIGVVKRNIDQAMFDLQIGLCKASQFGHVDIVQFIVENTEVDIRKQVGFIYAIENGKLVVKPQNLGPGYSTNAFTSACSQGHFDVVKYLFERGVSKEGLEIGFVRAAKFGHLRIVKYLFEKTKFDDKTLSHASELAARFSGHVEVVKYLHDKGVKFTYPMFRSIIEDGHGNTFEMFLDGGLENAMKKEPASDHFDQQMHSYLEHRRRYILNRV